MKAFLRLLPVFVLCVIALSSLYTAGDDSLSDDFGGGVGGTADAPLKVRFGDLVHIEWTTNRSVSYELRYETEVKNGISYGGPVDAGHGMVGNYTFYSKINGTYTLHFINDSDGMVLFHIRMTATSSESEIDEVWIYLSLALVATVIVVVLVLLVIRKRPGKKKEKGLVPVPKPPN